MLAVFKRRCPWAFQMPANGGAPPPRRCFIGLAPGCDGAKANFRLLNHVLYQLTGVTTFFLPG
eukprot:11083009-Lingulodinium_polyedra.AAC.1